MAWAAAIFMLFTFCAENQLVPKWMTSCFSCCPVWLGRGGREIDDQIAQLSRRDARNSHQYHSLRDIEGKSRMASRPSRPKNRSRFGGRPTHTWKPRTRPERPATTAPTDAEKAVSEFVPSDPYTPETRDAPTGYTAYVVPDADANTTAVLAKITELQNAIGSDGTLAKIEEINGLIRNGSFHDYTSIATALCLLGNGLAHALDNTDDLQKISSLNATIKVMESLIKNKKDKGVIQKLKVDQTVYLIDYLSSLKTGDTTAKHLVEFRLMCVECALSNILDKGGAPLGTAETCQVFTATAKLLPVPMDDDDFSYRENIVENQIFVLLNGVIQQKPILDIAYVASSLLLAKGTGTSGTDDILDVLIEKYCKAIHGIFSIFELFVLINDLAKAVPTDQRGESFNEVLNEYTKISGLF
eukprot:480150_1